MISTLRTRVERASLAVFFSAALAAGAMVAPAAQAQTFQDTLPPQTSIPSSEGAVSVQERLERLERDFLDLQTEYYQNGSRAAFQDDGSVSETVAGRMSVRMDEFEATLRRLTGQLEQINFDIRKTTERMDRLSGDIEYRLQALEGGGGGASVARSSQGQSAPAVSTVQRPKQVEVSSGATPAGTLGTLRTPTSALPQSEEEHYKSAYDLLYRGDYAGGEAALKAFLGTYPDSQYAGNAQYWLGESYYARRLYKEAAQAFLTGVQKYKKSEKAPDAMLKLGLSLINLGQTKDGCSALKSIKSEFPKVRQSVLNTAKRERKKAGCK